MKWNDKFTSIQLVGFKVQLDFYCSKNWSNQFKIFQESWLHNVNNLTYCLACLSMPAVKWEVVILGTHYPWQKCIVVVVIIITILGTRHPWHLYPRKSPTLAKAFLELVILGKKELVILDKNALKKWKISVANYVRIRNMKRGKAYWIWTG